MSDPKPTGQKIEDIEESIVSSASPFEKDSDDANDDETVVEQSDASDVADRDGAEALDGHDGQFTA